jgi:phage-related protein
MILLHGFIKKSQKTPNKQYLRQNEEGKLNLKQRELL